MPFEFARETTAPLAGLGSERRSLTQNWALPRSYAAAPVGRGRRVSEDRPRFPSPHGARRLPVFVGTHQDCGGDAEQKSLLGREQSACESRGVTYVPYVFTACCTFLCAIIMLSIGFAAYELDKLLSNDSMPEIDELVNHTVQILANADAASAYIRTTTQSGQIISDTALPQVLHALNASQAIVARLEQIAAHPVVQLSLGG